MRFLVFLLLQVCACHAQIKTQTHILMRGTGSHTLAYAFDSGKAGPTVVVIGGVHGDEPAGYLAPRQMLSWRPKSGVLVIVPDGNPRAIARKARFWKRNMNRLWPGRNNGDENERLAFELWELTKKYRPDLFITTHESRDFYARNPARYGQTLTYDFDEFSPRFRRVVTQVNQGIATPLHRFLLKVEPFETCPTFVAHKYLGATSVSIETSKTLPLQTRITHQKQMCLALFREFGMEIEPLRAR